MQNTSTSETVAFSIFLSYFLIIIGLFVVVVRSIVSSSSRKTVNSKGGVFVSLAVISFLYTWYYMLGFLVWSYNDHQQSLETQGIHLPQRITSWLINTGLFEQAWAIVSNDPVPWWISEPICLFTVGMWTTFLATNGRKYGIKHLWAYMILGQLVAISVAANLFYLAISLSKSSNKGKKSTSESSPPILWITVLISLATVGISPQTTEQTFLPNLLVMHFLIVLPLLPWGYHSFKGLSIRTSTLYILSTLMMLALRTRTTMQAVAALPEASRSFSGFLSASWNVLNAHPAQSSIGWDVIWTTTSSLVWVALSLMESPAQPTPPLRKRL